MDVPDLGDRAVASAREALRRRLFAADDAQIKSEDVPETKKEAVRWAEP